MLAEIGLSGAMNGIELIGALKDKGLSIPVVVIGGRGDVKLAVKAMKSGACDFIEKPFDDAALVEAIKGVVQYVRDKPAATAFGRILEGLTARGTKCLKESLLVKGAEISPTSSASPSDC